jgi:hypothetical protein
MPKMGKGELPTTHTHTKLLYSRRHFWEILTVFHPGVQGKGLSLTKKGWGVGEGGVGMGFFPRPKGGGVGGVLRAIS